jgi:hypothetical protein
MGICKGCGELVTIEPREQKPDSRQRVWKPVRHPGPDGKVCIGVTRGI